MKENSPKETTSAFTDRAFDINLNVVDNDNELQFPEKNSFTHHVSSLSRKVLLGFFKLVAAESLKDNYTDDLSDEFGNIINTLFQKFKLNDLDERGSLEDSLQNYIEKLKKYRFFVPNSIAKEGLEGLSPLEFNIGYEGDIKSVLECIENRLKALRDEKIRFWEALVEKYKEDKAGYDLGFRTKRTRQEKDLERFSKIDSEDIKNFKNSFKNFD